MMLSHVVRRLSRLPLAMAAMVVVACSGATEVPADPAAAQEQPTAEPSPLETGQDAPPELLDVSASEGTSIQDSRDPFLPVRSATAGEAPVETAPPGGPASPSSGTDAPPTTTPAPTSPPEDCTAAAADCLESLTLIEVSTDDDGPAVFQISTTLYEVRVGETFAGGLQLLALYGTCATVGYAGDTFEICATAESGLK